MVDLAGGEPSEKANVAISPGDTIVVSKAGVVYVLGEVNKPGAFLMENNTSMTIMKAIALSGSFTKVASLKHAIILRKSADGTAQTEVQLENIYHGKSPDIQLNAEDILFIPLSNPKYYGQMGIQAAIQAAVYSVYAFQLHN
jgi:polysaccharide export outer membrane protein